jgi:hypothetical protein
MHWNRLFTRADQSGQKHVEIVNVIFHIENENENLIGDNMKTKTTLE